MYFFTHIYMAKVLYRHFAEIVPLDKQAFRYGNIKPDLPSSQRKNHTLENYQDEVRICTRRLIEEDTNVKDFSVDLGVVCHFICDFFCYYHLNDQIHDRKLKHFFYEIALHHELLRMDRRKFKTILLSGHEPKKDLSLLIFEQRTKYLSQPHSMKHDIGYAFASAIWACESIIYYKTYPAYIMDEEGEMEDIVFAEGGRI